VLLFVCGALPMLHCGALVGLPDASFRPAHRVISDYRTFAAANLFGTQLTHELGARRFHSTSFSAIGRGKPSSLCPIIIRRVHCPTWIRRGRRPFAAYIRSCGSAAPKIGVARWGTWCGSRAGVHSNSLGQPFATGGFDVTRLLQGSREVVPAIGASTAPARAIGTLSVWFNGKTMFGPI